MPDEEATQRFLRALGLDVEEDRVQSAHSNLTDTQWHRAVYERHRYEAGELTEWPASLPLSPEVHVKLMSTADALIARFRRVE